MQLRGKTVLIPGAARPIGREIARKFASHGATLILPVFDWSESIAEMEKEFHEASVAGVTGRSGPAAVFFNDGYSAANRSIKCLLKPGPERQ